MPDNIYYNPLTGAHSFYSVKEPAWHLKGFISDKYETSRDVLEHAGLNFQVEKLPNTHIFPDGKQRTSNTSFFTYRTDTDEVLGDKIGNEYTIVQNVDAFAFFDAIAGENGIFYETAGALGKGERIFITAKLPKYIKVGANDVIEQYLFLTSSHDSTRSITAAFTPIRIVCNNTLNAALRHCSNVVRIRHTEGVKERLKEAHKVMGMVNTAAPLIEQAFNRMASVSITDAEVRKLIERALAPNEETLAHIKAGRWDNVSSVFKNTVNEIYAYGMMSDTQKLETTKGTVFGAYNAVTGFYQNVKKFKTQDDKVKNILLGGTVQQKVQKAFDLCLEFTKSGSDLFLN
jgi:phage/plasmid-like protein (TIGR03299 family)